MAELSAPSHNLKGSSSHHKDRLYSTGLWLDPLYPVGLRFLYPTKSTFTSDPSTGSTTMISESVTTGSESVSEIVKYKLYEHMERTELYDLIEKQHEQLRGMTTLRNLWRALADESSCG